MKGYCKMVDDMIEKPEEGKTFQFDKQNISGSSQIIKKILLQSTLPPFVVSLFFMIALLVSIFCKMFLYDYTLISSVLEDTTASYTIKEYNPQYQKEIETTHKKEIGKGTVVKVQSLQDNAILTSQGLIEKKYLSAPEKGYIAKSYQPLVVFIFALLCFGAFNLFLMRLIASYRAIRMLKKTNFKILSENVIRSIQGSTSTLKSIINVVSAVVVTWLIDHKLQTISVTYAFTGSDNQFLNWLITCYQDKIEMVRFTIFMIVYIIFGYIILLISLNKYTCKRCKMPFSFFITDEYTKNQHTIQQTEYREESISGRMRKVPYIVNYECYDHYTVRECSLCDYRNISGPKHCKRKI